MQTILIVDDEPDILDSLQAILEDAQPDLQVRTAVNGQDALRILQEERVDLIVSDYKMPGMDGLAFLEEAARLAPGVPRMIITAYPDLDVAMQAINHAGVQNFLTKPFRSEEVVEHVRTTLLGRRIDSAMKDSLERGTRGTPPAGT